MKYSCSFIICVCAQQAFHVTAFMYKLLLPPPLTILSIQEPPSLFINTTHSMYNYYIFIFSQIPYKYLPLLPRLRLQNRLKNISTYHETDRKGAEFFISPNWKESRYCIKNPLYKKISLIHSHISSA